MSLNDDLTRVLKKLRLSGLLQTLELRSRQATDDNLPHAEFLFRLLCDEVERREAKQLDLRLRRAQFEQPKTLEDFDFGFNPAIPRMRVVDLATCLFVEQKRNVLLVGFAGVGKSHVAQALGQRACRAGHSVLFTTAHQLFTELRASRADNSYERRMLRFTNPGLLIVDDVGLRPLRQDEPEDLYEVIRRRYQRGSLVCTSNRDVDEWYPLFGDKLLASAAMDRLLDGAEVLRMKGRSFRNPQEALAEANA